MNGKTDVFPGLILPQAVSRSGVCTAWRMRMGNSEEYLDAAAMDAKSQKRLRDLSWSRRRFVLVKICLRQ